MKKRIYDSPVCLLLQQSVFNRIKLITETKQISFSDFIRGGIELKLAQVEDENQTSQENSDKKSKRKEVK